MAAFDHIIFDCDGVLVDSERIADETLVVLLARSGVSLTRTEVDRLFRGLDHSQLHRIIAERFGVELPESFAADHTAGMVARMPAELRAVPGVAAAIEAIALPKSVVSNSSRARVEASLAATRLAGYFDGRIHTVEDAGRPKPAPDLYLHAARIADAWPARCLVVEDSRSGVAAAAAAGMTVIGFTGCSKAPEEAWPRLQAAGASRWLTAMSGLAALVAELSEAEGGENRTSGGRHRHH